MKMVLVLVLVVVLLALCGCSEVQLSPRYQASLDMWTATVASINEDCQNGNDNSCRKGLDKAARALRIFRDASYGKAVEE